MNNTRLTAAALVCAVFILAMAPTDTLAKNGKNTPYEIWGSDQSNSVPGKNVGTDGSFIWIWSSVDMERQIHNGATARPMGCDPANTPGAGPCDLKEVFPANLIQHDGDAPTGSTLGDLPLFGKLHGMLPDPQNLYMNVNSFVAGGGYVGIMDGRTKEAVALFRVTQVEAGAQRSVHMSFWNGDGSALLVANLHGKILERIDVTRDASGNITRAVLNRAASLGVGKEQVIIEPATAFIGNNAHGNALLSEVGGDYNDDAFGNLTPGGFCQENGCSDGPDYSGGGRPNNVIVCPIVSDFDNSDITTGGGGLLVADTSTEPMSIVGEYSKAEVNGAGCGGIQVGDNMWLNAGASASGAGLTQSTFTMYAFDDSVFELGVQSPGFPAPNLVFKDPGNTATLGNEINNPAAPATNNTGQLPGISTRRDAHGAARTLSGNFIHSAERIQNIVEVFSTADGNMQRVWTYDLTSKNGNGTGGDGPCAALGVADDPALPANDPAPDLMDTTPDGKYMVVALRGPVPASVLHAAQGSCPGVGIIRLLENGMRGKLVTVLRSAHQVPTVQSSTAVGGHNYTGAERSDVHGASVRTRVEDQ